MEGEVGADMRMFLGSQPGICRSDTCHSIAVLTAVFVCRPSAVAKRSKKKAIHPWR
jgi:hypothetical protein